MLSLLSFQLAIQHICVSPTSTRFAIIIHWLEVDEHHGNLITSAAEELIGGVFWGLLIDHFDCVVHSVCAMKQSSSSFR